MIKGEADQAEQHAAGNLCSPAGQHGPCQPSPGYGIFNQDAGQCAAGYGDCANIVRHLVYCVSQILQIDQVTSP